MGMSFISGSVSNLHCGTGFQPVLKRKCEKKPRFSGVPRIHNRQHGLEARATTRFETQPSYPHVSLCNPLCSRRPLWLCFDGPREAALWW